MNSKKYRKHQKEVEVKFIDDSQVKHIETLEEKNKQETNKILTRKLRSSEHVNSGKHNSKATRKHRKTEFEESSSEEIDKEVFKEKLQRKSVDPKRSTRKQSVVQEHAKSNPSSVKKERRKRKKSDSENDSSGESDEEVFEETSQLKPVALFEEGDVSGKEIFGFCTPKRRNAMLEKAKLSVTKTTPNSVKHSPKVNQNNGTPRTPKTHAFTPRVRRSILLNGNGVESSSPSSLKIQRSGPDTVIPKASTPKGVRRSIMWNDSNIKETSSPRSKANQNETLNSERCVPKTPHSIRKRLKSKIAAKVMRDKEGFSSEESDLFSSEEDSNYENSGSESESSSSEKEDVTSSKKEVVQRDYKAATVKKRRKDLTYAISVEEYFSSNSGKKNKTSSHTLSQLKNPQINEEQLNRLLGNTKAHCTHKSALETLQRDCMLQQSFDRWCFSLREGFSILLYGLGSKKAILNKFCEKILANDHVLVINGFFPGLTIKEIVNSLADELLKIKDVPTQLHEVVEAVELKLSYTRTPPVFLIVHNLDGAMLQSDKAQAFLSRLANIPKCHLLASIDHINAPLLWDDKKLSDYNFVWEDVTSYYSYVDETSFENSLLVKRSGNLVLTSLKNVFQSLTKNGKDIFKLLLEDHLANAKNQKYSGVGFSDLYWKCRDNFLVSTDLALRSQLTEFLDHQIVKWRKDSDQLIIPLEASILQQFHSLLEEREM